MAGTYPAHQAEFAPGVASSTVPAPGDWVPLPKVLGWSFDWGSQDEFTEPGAGTGTLLVDNATGDFDPDNVSGPYFGDLRAGTWVRILVGTTSANTDGYYGQVGPDGFQVGASQYPDSVVVLKLLDVTDFLANTDVVGSVYQHEVLDDAPALWWRLGESDGTQATDSSGNGRHGTYAGGATGNSQDGLIDYDDDKAIAFDGLDDVVTFASIAPGNAWSIEFWIRADAQPGEPAVVYLLGGGTPYAGDIAIYETASSDPKLRFAYTNPATGSRTEYVSTADVFDGARHHVVITQSGSTTNLYVDSIEGKTLASGAAASITWGDMQLALASDDFSPLTRHVGGVGAFLAGVVDEFAIYPTALSSGRVFTHYVEAFFAWGNEYTSDRVTRILDLVAFSASHRTIAQGDSLMQGTTLAKDAGALLREAALAEGGLVAADHQDGGKLRFVNRRYKWSATASVTSQATFGDGGGAEIPVDAMDLVDDRVINHAAITRNGGATVVVNDIDIDPASTSQTDYRIRSLSESGLLYETDAESQYRGERWVAEKKDRHRRCKSITLRPRKSTHPAWAHVFARKWLDRITVKWRPSYGGTYTFHAWIIGISQSWSPKAGLETKFHLAPVPFDTTAEPYWIAGTSTAGVTTRPGY